MAASTRPDLVILDLGLPDIDGIEVIRKLRAWTPVPIVVLSGRADSRDKVDIAHHQVTGPDGAVVHLTPIEWQLVEAFVVTEPGMGYRFQP